MTPRTRHNPVVPTGAEVTALYVPIEISRKGRVVGLKSPWGRRSGCTRRAPAAGTLLRPAGRGTAAGRRCTGTRCSWARTPRRR